MMPGLPSEQGEGGGFLGFDWEAEFGTGREVATERFEPLGEHGHQRPIARAAARDDVVDGLILHFGMCEAFEAVCNGFRGKGGRCGDGVFRLAADAAATGEELSCVLAAELF